MAATTPSSVLLVDSDEGLARSLQILLEDEASCDVRVAHCAPDAVAELQRASSVDLVVIDAATALAHPLRPWSSEGEQTADRSMTLLETIRRRFPDVVVILMTAHQAVLASVEQGGLVNGEALLKPIDPITLLESIEAAIAGRLHSHHRSLGSDASLFDEGGPDIAGHSGTLHTNGRSG